MVFQSRAWIAERIAWTVIGVVVALGLLGVFAGGPPAQVSVALKGGALTVEYPRFAHKTARSHFTIRIRPASPPETRVHLGPDFLKYYDVEALEPQPLHSTSDTSGLDLAFAAPDADDLAVHLAGRAKRFGIAAITVSVNGGAPIMFRQLIYP